MGIRTLAVAGTAAALAGCAELDLPLGGIAPGRGAPLEARTVQMEIAPNSLPDVAVAIPEVVDDVGHVINPIDDERNLRAGPRGLGWGMTVGLTDRVDLGVSFSRGLHGVVRLVEFAGVSLSVSPALYRQVNALDDFDFPVRSKITLTNRNLTALLNYRPRVGMLDADYYVGSAISDFTVEVATPDLRLEHRARTPTVLGGFRISPPRRSDGTQHPLSISIEVLGTWITQRDGRRELVFTRGFTIALRHRPAW